MTVLPHSFDSSLFKTKSSIKKETGKIKLSYFGSLYGKRSIKPLIKAITKIMKNEPRILNNVIFELTGHIPNSELKIVEDFQFKSKIKIKPGVNYLTSLKLSQLADILLVIDASTKLSQFLPSKLMDYMGTGKYIFGITPKKGASSDLIKKIGGIVVDPKNYLEIAQKITEVIKLAKAKKLPSLNKKIIQSFEINSVHKPLIQIIGSLTGKNS